MSAPDTGPRVSLLKELGLAGLFPLILVAASVGFLFAAAFGFLPPVRAMGLAFVCAGIGSLLRVLIRWRKGLPRRKVHIGDKGYDDRAWFAEADSLPALIVFGLEAALGFVLLLIGD